MVKQETIEQIKQKITVALHEGFKENIEQPTKTLPEITNELKDEVVVSLALKFAKEIPDVEVEEVELVKVKPLPSMIEELTEQAKERLSFELWWKQRDNEK